jgi:hypothetical protein
MSFNLANIPYSFNWVPTAVPASADILSIFRMPAEGRILSCYLLNDAAIAASTNTVRLELLDGGVPAADAAATGTTLIADKPAATAVTADAAHAFVLTAAAQDVASGTILRVRVTLAGSGTLTNPTVQIEYMLATGATT